MLGVGEVIPIALPRIRYCCEEKCSNDGTWNQSISQQYSGRLSGRRQLLLIPATGMYGTPGLKRNSRLAGPLEGQGQILDRRGHAQEKDGINITAYGEKRVEKRRTYRDRE